MKADINFNNTDVNNSITNHIRICIAETLRIPESLYNCTGINFKAYQKSLMQPHSNGLTAIHEKSRYMILCVMANNRYYNPGNVWECTRAAIRVLLPQFLMTLSKSHYKIAHSIPCKLNNLLFLLSL